MIDRVDMNGELIILGDRLFNRANGNIYTVVFSKDILAFGIIDDDNMFEFMSDWVADEWVVIKQFRNVKNGD